MRNKTKWIILLSAALAGLLLTCLYRNYFRFSQTKWKNDTERWTMVSSIINRELLHEKSFAETIRLLGKPSLYREIKKTGRDTTAFTLVYLTGGRKWVDLESLCVDIADDTVRKVYVSYD